MIGVILILALLCWWEIKLATWTIINSERALRISEDIFLLGGRRILRLLQRYSGVICVIQKIDSVQLPRKCMIIANHQSLLDILLIRVLFAPRTIRFVAKSSLQRGFPAVSRLLRLQRHAFINRRHVTRKMMDDIRDLGSRAGDAFCPTIFPEGHRSKDGNLLDFNSAGVRLLQSKDMSHVAVAVDNGYRLAKLRNIIIPHTPIVLHAAVVTIEPPPDGRNNMEEQLQNIRHRIGKQQQIWRMQS